MTKNLIRIKNRIILNSYSCFKNVITYFLRVGFRNALATPLAVLLYINGVVKDFTLR